MILSAAVRHRLEQLEQQVKGLLGMRGLGPVNVQWVSGGTPLIVANPLEMFPVQVTAYDATTDSYTWHEQTIDDTADSGYLDLQAGRYGDPDHAPLKEMNGVVVDEFPFYAFIRRRCDNTTVDIVYEFDAHGDGSSGPTITPVVTDICITVSQVAIPTFDSSQEDPTNLNMLVGNGSAFVSRPIADVLDDLGGLTDSFGD